MTVHIHIFMVSNISFLGKYINPKQIIKQKKSNIIHGLNRHNVKIHNFNCGWEFEKVITL